MTGMTSYSWLVTYLGTVCSGRVAVPLDVSLPAGDMCELIDRADVTVLVLDQLRQDVAAMVKEKCPKVRHVIIMNEKQRQEGGSVFR